MNSPDNTSFYFCFCLISNFTFTCAPSGFYISDSGVWLWLVGWKAWATLLMLSSDMHHNDDSSRMVNDGDDEEDYDNTKNSSLPCQLGQDCGDGHWLFPPSWSEILALWAKVWPPLQLSWGTPRYMPIIITSKKHQNWNQYWWHKSLTASRSIFQVKLRRGATPYGGIRLTDTCNHDGLTDVGSGWIILPAFRNKTKKKQKQYWGGTWGSVQRTQRASWTLGGEGDDQNQHNHFDNDGDDDDADDANGDNSHDKYAELTRIKLVWRAEAWALSNQKFWWWRWWRSFHWNDSSEE